PRGVDLLRRRVRPEPDPVGAHHLGAPRADPDPAPSLAPASQPVGGRADLLPPRRAAGPAAGGPYRGRLHHHRPDPGPATATRPAVGMPPPHRSTTHLKPIMKAL